MEASDKARMLDALRTIVTSLCPDAAFLEKYGGVVVERVAGGPEGHFCGIFAYARHVSLEFSQGARLDDPRGLLEGSGTQRRHLKLRSVADIEAKACRAFLEQAARL